MKVTEFFSPKNDYVGIGIDDRPEYFTLTAIASGNSGEFVAVVDPLSDRGYWAIEKRNIKVIDKLIRGTDNYLTLKVESVEHESVGDGPWTESFLTVGELGRPTSTKYRFPLYPCERSDDRTIELPSWMIQRIKSVIDCQTVIIVQLDGDQSMAYASCNGFGDRYQFTHSERDMILKFSLGTRSMGTRPAVKITNSHDGDNGDILLGDGLIGQWYRLSSHPDQAIAPMVHEINLCRYGIPAIGVLELDRRMVQDLWAYTLEPDQVYRPRLRAKVESVRDRIVLTMDDGLKIEYSQETTANIDGIWFNFGRIPSTVKAKKFYLGYLESLSLYALQFKETSKDGIQRDLFLAQLNIDEDTETTVITSVKTVKHNPNALKYRDKHGYWPKWYRPSKKYRDIAA